RALRTSRRTSPRPKRGGPRSSRPLTSSTAPAPRRRRPRRPPRARVRPPRPRRRSARPSPSRFPEVVVDGQLLENPGSPTVGVERAEIVNVGSGLRNLSRESHGSASTESRSLSSVNPQPSLTRLKVHSGRGGAPSRPPHGFSRQARVNATPLLGERSRLGSARVAGKLFTHAAGWSSLVARRAHNPKVAGSNPAPATNRTADSGPTFRSGAFCIAGRRSASGQRSWFRLLVHLLSPNRGSLSVSTNYLVCLLRARVPFEGRLPRELRYRMCGMKIR
ncbi:MAG: hypothetical protein QOJ67_3203, partial [Acidimicrobiaceae bacterium]